LGGFGIFAPVVGSWFVCGGLGLLIDPDPNEEDDEALGCFLLACGICLVVAGLVALAAALYV